MATTFTGLRVQDTYNAILKIGDNTNLSGTAKILSDGVGNSSSIYLSTTRFGIGITPAYQFHTSGNAKIGGNLIISGDLTVNGNLTYLNVTDLQVEDPLIKLAKDNTSNTLDIGFFGKYVESATTKYTGLFWDASTDKFRLYEGLQVEPTTTVDVTGTGYTRSLLNADLEGNVTGTVSSLSNHDTNDLVEGSVNQYFTTTRARASFTEGTGVTITDGEIAIGQDVDTDSDVTFGNITGSAISGTTGTFIGGMSSFETVLGGTTNNDDWQNSPITILERGNVQGTETADKYSPNLNFHWGAKYSASLWMDVSGALHYGQYSGAGTPSTDGTIKAANFIGALTGNVTGGTISGTTGSFTGLVTGIAPTSDLNFATKKYVDDNSSSPQTLAQTLALGNTSGANDIIMADDQKVFLGTDSDLEIYHDGTDGYIDNINGALVIQNNGNDKSIIFKTDNGIGDITEYFKIDGNINRNVISVTTQLNDNVPMIFGSGAGRPSIKYDSTASQLFISGESKFLNNLFVVETITSTKDGIALQMDGGSSAEGIRLQADSSTTYPVFLRSINPASGESSPWIYKEASTPWGIWHNNPSNSFDFTRAGSMSGAIATDVGGETNSVMIRLNNTDGSGTFVGGVTAPSFSGNLTGAASLNVLKAGDTMTGTLQINSNASGEGSNLKIYSTTQHQYPQIFSDSTREAMWNYKNDTATWYVGIRNSLQLISEKSAFAFYNTSQGVTVGGYSLAGDHYAKNSSRSKIFYDLDNVNFYYDPATGSQQQYTYNVSGTSGNYGSQIIVGQTSVDLPYTLQDSNHRPVLAATGAYPVLHLNHTSNTNTNHGPTIQFTHNGVTDDRQWVIGSTGDGISLDIGFSSDDYQDPNDNNPHNGISGYRGKTYMRFRENGNIGLGASNGGWGGISGGNPAYAIDTKGTLYNNTDVRAPIFYAHDDINYYLDPAATSSSLNVAGSATFGGDVYGKSVNAAYSQLYRFGGIFFTWDSDSYGTNFFHSITSTSNGTYSDNMTWNSYGNVRINFDSNDNDSGDFRIGHHTTGTANTLFILDNSGSGTFNGAVRAGTATIDTSYGPAILNSSTSAGWGSGNLPYLGSNNSSSAVSSIFIHNIHATFRTDNKRTGATGRAGVRMAIDAAGTNWWDCGLIGDEFEVYRNSSTQRMLVIDSSGNVTGLTSLRSPIFYDTDDTTYFVNPASNGSRIKNLVIVPQSESWSEGIRFDMPTQGAWGGLRWSRAGASGNAANWALGYAGNESTDDMTWWSGTSNHRWRLNHSGDNTVQGSFRAPIFYDSDDTGYYGNFASTSVMSRINGGNGDNPAFVCVANASYGAGTELEIGGWSTGTTVSKIRNSNGNLHIDSKSGNDIYLQHYPTGNVRIGGGGGYLLSYNSVRSPIFYDYTDTTYYLDPASNTYSLKINGGIQTNAANGNVIIKHTVSEANSWLFQENAPNWGLFWLNEAANGTAFGSYTTVGAEFIGFRNGSNTGFKNPSAWTGINSAAYAGWLLSNYSGYFWTASTQYSETDMRAPIFYDANDTGYFVNPASGTEIYDLKLKGANHKYLEIDPTGNYESMVRYMGASGGDWYVGKRTATSSSSNSGISTSDYHFYSATAGKTVGGVTSNGGIHAQYFGFTVGDPAATFTYNDTTTRSKVYVSSQYPVITLNVSNNANASHGGTLQFVASGYDSKAQWVIGSSGQCQFLDFGFGQPSNNNPHVGISGYQGKTMMRMIKSGKVGIGGNWGSFGSGDPSYDLDVLGTIRASSDVIAFSDKRVKENIKTIDNALDKVTKLRGVTYTRKDIEDKSTKVGVIAQEVLEILPEVVNQDDKGMYSVAYGNIVGVLIEAVKEQQKQINELTNIIDKLNK